MTEKAKAGSKFSGLMAAVKDRQDDIPEPGEVKLKATVDPEDAVNSEEAVRRGRPRGKRSSSDFVQVTAYISKDTHRGVKIALLREGDGREFSELVEELLAGWLRQTK